MGAPRRTSDAGAAVVDFVLMSVLLVFLLFAVVQVAVYFYARNVVESSVADAARYASTQGVAPAAGGTRAQRLIDGGLDTHDARSLRCTGVPGRDPASGLPVTTVRCTGRLRLLFVPLRLPLSLAAQSSVLREGAP